MDIAADRVLDIDRVLGIAADRVLDIPADRVLDIAADHVLDIAADRALDIAAGGYWFILLYMFNTLVWLKDLIIKIASLWSGVGGIKQE